MKLVISASPHISSGATTRKIMGDVLIALCPALIAAIVICALVGVLVELVAYRPVRRKGTSTSALITAI